MLVRRGDVLVCEMWGCLVSGDKGVIGFVFLHRIVCLSYSGVCLWVGFLFRLVGVRLALLMGIL